MHELIDKKLAKELLPPEPINMDFPVLVGQQFRVTLISCGSLDKITVQLDIGEQLTCSMFNLSEASNKKLDVLQHWLDKQLIMFVKAVENNR